MNVSSGAVPTRLGKRKVGRRDSLLWDLIVNNNDDICFTHILPRLNGTDIKFLYDVNEETRALIKRSSRAGDLKKRFKVREMSSISTLEFAWENKSWWSGYLWTKHLSACKLLKRINSSCSSGRERRKSVSGMNGRLMRPHSKVIWKWSSIALQMSVLSMSGRVQDAAGNGHLEVLKYLREEAKAPWDWRTAFGRLKMVISTYSNILLSVSMINMTKLRVRMQPENGHLDCLKYLRETAKAPWNYWAVRDAHYYKQPECLQYLLDNNCPLTPGWRYEHGTLYDSEDEEIH